MTDRPDERGSPHQRPHPFIPHRLAAQRGSPHWHRIPCIPDRRAAQRRPAHRHCIPACIPGSSSVEKCLTPSVSATGNPACQSLRAGVCEPRSPNLPASQCPVWALHSLQPANSSMNPARAKQSHSSGDPSATTVRTRTSSQTKPEPTVESSTPGGVILPVTPGSQLGRIPDFPDILPSTTQQALLNPLVSSGSSPSQSVPTLLQRSPSASSQSSSMVVLKTERLSPTSVCGDGRRNSGPVSPTPSLGLQPSYSTPGRARPESSRMETRRITHISAEQKRRFNIKLGFDTLHSLVTTLHSQPSVKVSKATTLQKTADYICKLQQERAYVQDEVQRLREEIEELNGTINQCQQQLPDTGVPITRQRFDQMREMFDEYVQSRTLQNWKFWVFSIIIRPLFESFNGMVSTANIDDLSRTSLSWLDHHCSLPALRPAVLSSLRQLSTSTSILSDPSLMPEQATRAVTRGNTSLNFS